MSWQETTQISTYKEARLPNLKARKAHIVPILSYLLNVRGLNYGFSAKSCIKLHRRILKFGVWRIWRAYHMTACHSNEQPAPTDQRLLKLYLTTPFKPAGLLDLRYERSPDQGQCETPAIKTLISPDFSTEHNHDGRI